jgi:hypothetical protein
MGFCGCSGHPPPYGARILGMRPVGHLGGNIPFVSCVCFHDERGKNGRTESRGWEIGGVDASPGLQTGGFLFIEVSAQGGFFLFFLEEARRNNAFFSVL